MINVDKCLLVLGRKMLQPENYQNWKIKKLVFSFRECFWIRITILFIEELIRMKFGFVSVNSVSKFILCRAVDTWPVRNPTKSLLRLPKTGPPSLLFEDPSSRWYRPILGPRLLKARNQRNHCWYRDDVSTVHWTQTTTHTFPRETRVVLMESSHGKVQRESCRQWAVFLEKTPFWVDLWFDLDLALFLERIFWCIFTAFVCVPILQSLWYSYLASSAIQYLEF